jgi:hypothetical protein
MAPAPSTDLAVLTLQRADVRRLERPRHSDFYPGGARLTVGGVGMDVDGDLCGWVAYGDLEGDLETPTWPQDIVFRRLEDCYPWSVDVAIVYHGGNWRRSVGAVNARLSQESRQHARPVDADLTERAWLTMSQRLEADSYRRRQRDYLRGNQAA